MSNKQEKKSVESVADEHEETDHVMSKGAKKRAKKQAKKAAEAAKDSSVTEEKRKSNSSNTSSDKTNSSITTTDASSDSSQITTPEKPSSEKVDLTKKNSDEKLQENNDLEQNENKNNKKESDEKPERKEHIVPIIQRFDANGKALKTIAGNGFVHLGEITPHNVLQLKKLNESVFPILYNDKFYVEARSCGELGRLAYYNDVVVGAVCCRIDDISDEKSLYIMTLGTLAAYRQIGIGTVLIDYVLKLCKRMEEIKTVHLHVQVNNMNAVHFYEKHGFTNDGTIENYYRISPRDAFLLFKRVRY